MDELREKLAALAHEQWSGWMRWMFKRGKFVPMKYDGVFQTVWVMPGYLRERWERQMKTSYDRLTNDEKESDRTEADRVLVVIAESSGQPRT